MAHISERTTIENEINFLNKFPLIHSRVSTSTSLTGLPFGNLLIYKLNNELYTLDLDDDAKYLLNKHLIFDEKRKLIVNLTELSEFILVTRHAV